MIIFFLAIYRAPSGLCYQFVCRSTLFGRPSFFPLLKSRVRMCNLSRQQRFFSEKKILGDAQSKLEQKNSSWFLIFALLFEICQLQDASRNHPELFQVCPPPTPPSLLLPQLFFFFFIFLFL